MNAPVWFAIFMLLVTAAVALSNIHYGAEKRTNARLKMAQDELQHLAKVAERERIARDLHDVLGHTLSVIVLKSELAARRSSATRSEPGRRLCKWSRLRARR